MDLLTNDLSIHKQFHDIASFRVAFRQLMAMREVAGRFSREVYCHRALLTVEAMPGVMMQRALQRFPTDERRSAMLWLTRGGPFWDDLRRHGTADWLECRGRVVTDSAVGEAAYRTLHAVECGLISAVPSDWDYSPVDVVWRRRNEAGDDEHAQIHNFRDSRLFEDFLRTAAPPIRSWDDLQEASKKRFAKLIFAGHCFDHLSGFPFVQNAAERIVVLLDVLDQFARAFDAVGVRTSKGQQIYQDYFSGNNAPFSDSSDTEKRHFRDELTFRHPSDSQKLLFCTWHGKVNYPAFPLRIHFSWPIQSGEPVYVVYIGPKITRR